MAPTRPLHLALAAWLAFAGGISAQSVVVLEADRDGSLYSEQPTFGNGAGVYIFAGRTAMNDDRRACLHFDLSSIPAGSTIDQVELTLTMTRAISADEPATLHRLTADWGEGASDAPGEEGTGVAAQPGDVTWSSRFFGTSTWTTAGGDFDPTVLSTTLVGATQTTYVWTSTPAFVAAAQGWLDTPATNFGMILRGNESATSSAKRYASRENSTVGDRPILTVTYTPPMAPPCMAICGDCNENGVGPNILDALLAAQFGAGISTPSPSQSACCDVDDNGVLSVLDALAMARADVGLPVTLTCP